MDTIGVQPGQTQLEPTDVPKNTTDELNLLKRLSDESEQDHRQSENQLENTNRIDGGSSENTGAVGIGNPSTAETPYLREEVSQPPVEPGTLKCGCHNLYTEQLQGWDQFITQVNVAADKLPPVRQHYDNVQVLIVYWNPKFSDRRVLAENAIVLRDLFEEHGFKPKEYILLNESKEDIENYGENVIHQCFEDWLRERIKEVNKMAENNLLILYYAGHGAKRTPEGENRSATYVWQPSAQSTKCLEWKEFQFSLRRAACDVLFLFDCCHATAMIDEDDVSPWQRRCEILAASGATSTASGAQGTTFTEAVTLELGKALENSGIDMYWLWCLMNNPIFLRDNLLSPVWWRRYSQADYQTSMFLRSRKPKETMYANDDKDSGISINEIPEYLEKLNNTRVLVSMELANPAEILLVEDFMKMFRLRPSNVKRIQVNMAMADKIKLISLFPHGSSLAIATIPTWLWKSMNGDPAIRYIDTVLGDDIVAPMMIAEAEKSIQEMMQRKHANEMIKEATASRFKYWSRVKAVVTHSLKEQERSRQALEESRRDFEAQKQELEKSLAAARLYAKRKIDELQHDVARAREEEQRVTALLNTAKTQLNDTEIELNDTKTLLANSLAKGRQQEIELKETNARAETLGASLRKAIRDSRAMQARMQKSEKRYYENRPAVTVDIDLPTSPPLWVARTQTVANSSYATLVATKTRGLGGIRR